jgi:hypothetical protein
MAVFWFADHFFYNYWPQKSFCSTKFLLNPNLSNINAIGVWCCLVQKLEDASPHAFRHLFTFLFKTAGRRGIYRSVTSWIETFLVKTSHLLIKIATFEFQNHAPISIGNAELCVAATPTKKLWFAATIKNGRNRLDS